MQSRSCRTALAALLALSAPATRAGAEPDPTTEPTVNVPVPDAAPTPAPRVEFDPDHRDFGPRRIRWDPPGLLALPTRPRDRSLVLAVSETAAANGIIWSAALASGSSWPKVSPESWARNLRGPWVFDPNKFETNQLGHPYQGHLAFSAARSSGFSFWGAAAFPLVASTLWELFGENDLPSINDEITTPVGGAFLGEVLFRLSQMVLDGGGTRPSAARRAAAWLVSPPASTSQLVAGNRFRTRSVEAIPSTIETRLGASFGGMSESHGEVSTTAGLLSGSVQVTHGLPVGDWRPRQPFDHFDFYGSIIATRKPWMVCQVRGLLHARELNGERSRGFWGLWGLYDLTTLRTYRVSTSGVGFGVTGQRWTSHGLTLQGTAIAGGGFGAAGTAAPTRSTPDYHYGLGGLAILDARIIAADRGAVRLSFRQYYVGGLVSPDADGQELIAYLTTGATLRLFGRHAVGLDVTRSRRWAGFPSRDDSFESFSQVIATYTYLSDKTMGSGLTVVASGQ